MSTLRSRARLEACIEDMTPEVAKAYLITILTERRYKDMVPSELIDVEYEAMVRTKEYLEKDKPVDAMDRMWEEDRKEISEYRETLLEKESKEFWNRLRMQEARRVVVDMMG